MCEECGKKEYPHAWNSDRMMGITYVAVEQLCPACKEYKILYPQGDWSRAERYETGGFVHPYEWD